MTRGARLVAVAVAVAVALGGAASPARAQPAAQASDAEALVARGIELRRQRKDAEAFEAFRRAYAASPGPRTLAQIALAEQALGRWVEAERDLANALQAAQDPWIDHNRDVLAKGLASIQAQLGWIEVSANVDGAELWLDGVRAGTLPMAGPLRAPAGSVVIEVRAPGYATAKRLAVVNAGGNARETLRLVAFAPADVPGAGAAADGEARPPAPDESPVTPATPAAPASPARRAVGLVLVGAGAVAAGVGVYFGLQTLSKKSDRDPHCQGDVCDPTGVTLDQEARVDATRATVWLGAGLVAIGGGAWLLWDSRARAPAPPRAAVRVTPLLGTDRAGVTVGGAW